MAVIGAVIGVAVIGGVTYDNYSDYDDYGDYSNYSNYSNYSDAAERRQRRIDAKKSEIENQKYDINTYKTNKVNDYLQSQSLKQQSGVNVNIVEVKRDGYNKIESDIKSNTERETAGLTVQIEELKKAVETIDHILEGDD